MSTALEAAKQNSPQPAELAKNYTTERLSNVQRLGNILAASGYFSDMRDAAQGAVKVMAGEELGIAPVAAVMGIHIIKGKVSLSANLIAAQVRRHGYDYKAKFDQDGACTIHFIGKNGEPLGASSFTESDARIAGVYSDMYKKFPRNMYFSRAMSNGAKWYCPEVMSGMPIYTPEELGATVDGNGDFVSEPEPAPKTRAEKAKAAKDVAAAKIAVMQNGGTQAEASAAVEHIIDAETEPVPAQTSDVQAIEDADKFKALTAFRELKNEMRAQTGSDDLYYRALGAAGYEKSNQIPREDLRAVYRAVAKAFTQWKAEQPLPEVNS